MKLFLILILMVSALANIVSAQFNIAPTVSITTSDNSLEVDKNVLVTALARDSDGSIESVKFYRNGALFKVDISAPYNYSSDSPQTSRSYSFYAVATDNDGGTATSNTTFVNWSDPAPEVFHLYPVRDGTILTRLFLGNTIKLLGEYRDNSGNLSSATISDLGAGNKKGNTGTFPSIGLPGESLNCYFDSIERSFTFPPDTPIGPYTFRTEVVDANGAGDIGWLVVTLYDPSRALKISISDSPASFTDGDSVTITATASDPDGSISRVSFYHNGSFMGRDYNPPYTYTYENAQAGIHYFHAYASTSGAGPNSKSNTVTVTVKARFNILPDTRSNKPPYLYIGGGPGSFGSTGNLLPGESITIYAVASDPDGSIANVKFYRNSTLVKTDAIKPYDYTESRSTPGSYDFYAVATDYDGGTKTSGTQTETWGDPNPAPGARLYATHTTPFPGQTIILTGRYYDQNKNLSAATIRDLGVGNKNGHMGVFQSIGTAGEAIICTSVYIDRSFTFPPYTPIGPYTFRTEVVDTNGKNDIEWLVVNVQDPSPALKATDSNSYESITTVKVGPGKFPVIFEDGDYENLDKPKLIWTVNNLFESEFDFEIVPAEAYKFYVAGREVEANFYLKTLGLEPDLGLRIPGSYDKIVKEDGVYHLVLDQEFIERFIEYTTNHEEVTAELNDFIDRVNLIKSNEIDNMTEAEIDSILFIGPKYTDNYEGVEKKREGLKGFTQNRHFQSTNVFWIGKDLYSFEDDTKDIFFGTTMVYIRDNYPIRRKPYFDRFGYDFSYLRDMIDPKATPPSNFDPLLHTDPDANPFVWVPASHWLYFIYDNMQWKFARLYFY